MTKIKPILAVVLLLFAGLVQAATITKNLEFVVKSITVGEGSLGSPTIGQVFQGILNFDDANLTTEPDGTSSLGFGQFDIQLDFQGFDLANAPNTPMGQFLATSATFSANGALTNLEIFADFANALNFSAPDFGGGNSPMTFSFDLQRIPQGEDIGQSFAIGSGIIREPVVVQQTPLPGAVWLFVSGLGLLASRRRRIVD